MKTPLIGSKPARWKKIVCTVQSGKGTRPNTEKDIFDEEHQEKNRVIRELCGVGSVPGSLNLDPVQALWLRCSEAVDSSYGPLFVARLRDLDCVFRTWPPHRTVGKPARRLLVYSDYNLRKTLGLRDGDRVELEIPIRSVLNFAILDRAVVILRPIRRRFGAILRPLRSKRP